MSLSTLASGQLLASGHDRCSFAVRKEQSRQLRCRLCRTEQIALHFGTAESTKQLLLLLRFDAFRRCRHVAGRCDIYHRLNDGRGAAWLRDVVNEAAVDLDFVE